MKKTTFTLFSSMLATLLLAVIMFSGSGTFAQDAKAKNDTKEPAKQETKYARSKPAASKKSINKKETAKAEAKSDTLKTDNFGGLKWRSIGPALTSGRIADFAVNPANHSEWYVGVASGHVWKTMNNGTTFEPVFDNYGSYSIGIVVMDPNHSNVVWIGTGENNHQRALGYGDGVYKTTDAGKTWKNMGLKESRQIGGIVIDPKNSDIVYVAAEGSVWGPGGERGLYKTTDGGKTWKKILEISENTGVNNILMDPRNSNVLYATSEQRRRHVFTKIGGGPETAIYKSTNAGETWDKLTSGIPSVDKGGIGLAISPVNPDVIYAIIEAAEDGSGFYRSNNQGATWQKMSSHSAQGQYYNEIVCDPLDVDKVYSTETVSQVTVDGGKTWQAIGNNKRHVDDHAIWIDPNDTKHLMIGGDGGIYESFDAGKEYIFKSNLPVTQFYRVQVDNSEPFYYVYGGTQDNNSLGGPSRNFSRSGVTSDEWFPTNGGDGFFSQIDPEDPNIVYAESQYGGMVRYDRKSETAIDIRPEPRKGEDTYKWNWNTPLIISPHSHTRLYCTANKVFRSDDRGNTWQVISDDLTAKIDRNSWPVMGKYWPMKAVQKDISTSLYGTIVSFEESPVKENLLFAGTDDGLIQMTDDAGKNWVKTDKFPGVPENTYVSDIQPSKFDANVVFASFDNILRDDFTPYVYKSADKGRTWVSIAGNLPKNGTVHSIQQDHVNPDLLFAGTEFGCFFTVDGGKAWIQLKSGIPTIPVRDIAIQKRENDLVIATFGRGFYILDDYTPLRTFNKEILEKDAYLFPVKDALMFPQTRGGGQSGSMPYVAKNPEFGAVFTYYLKEKLAPKTLKENREEKEGELFKKGEKIPMPTPDELRAEENELPSYVAFTIADENGNVIRTIKKAPASGIQRLVWDMRSQSTRAIEAGEKFDPMADNGGGLQVAPGKYKVSVSLTIGDQSKLIAGPETFTCKVIGSTSFPVKDRAALVGLYKKVTNLSNAVNGTESYAEGLYKRVRTIEQALAALPVPNDGMNKRSKDIVSQLDIILNQKFNRKSNVPSDEENPPSPVTLNSRLGTMTSLLWTATSEPTQTQMDAYNILNEEFPPIYEQIKKLGETDIPALENELNKIGAPLTPGRLPVWNK